MIGDEANVYITKENFLETIKGTNYIENIIIIFRLFNDEYSTLSYHIQNIMP